MSNLAGIFLTIKLMAQFLLLLVTWSIYLSCELHLLLLPFVLYFNLLTQVDQCGKNLSKNYLTRSIPAEFGNLRSVMEM